MVTLAMTTFISLSAKGKPMSKPAKKPEPESSLFDDPPIELLPEGGVPLYAFRMLCYIDSDGDTMYEWIIDDVEGVTDMASVLMGLSLAHAECLEEARGKYAIEWEEDD
jgi:hypothetical protein